MQRDKMFEPHLLVVPAGSIVEFQNRDPWFHDAFSISGNKLDLRPNRAGGQKTVRFDRAGGVGVLQYSSANGGGGPNG